MAAAVSMVFYGLALFLAVVFVALLFILPRFTLDTPGTIWNSEKKWVEDKALLYSFPIVGLIVFSVIVILFDGGFVARIAAYAGGFVTVLLSYLIDKRNHSFPGVFLDVSIGLSIILSFLCYLAS